MTHGERGVPPLRIAAHNGAPEWGGAEIAVCRLLAGLRGRGHAVRLYYNRDLVARGAAGFGLDTERLYVGGDGALHHGLRVARTLRRWTPDMLIAGTFRKLLHLSVGARLAGVPLVSRVGLSSDVPRSAKYRFVFRHLVDRVVVNDAELRAAYLEHLPGVAPGRVLVVHKGVAPPADPPARAAAREALGLPPGAFVVGALARLVEQKRLDRWIDVVASLGAGVTGLVAGDGPRRAELEARARERGADVRFVGYLDDPAPALSAMDVLLITSDRESLANAMLEALAHGVPVVSTPVSGAREALEAAVDGEAAAGDDAPPGIVAATFEPPDLAGALRRLVREAARRAAMSAAARRRAAERFDEATMLERWERILADAAARSYSEANA